MTIDLLEIWGQIAPIVFIFILLIIISDGRRD